MRVRLTKTASSTRPQAHGERTGEHRSLTKARDLEAGRVRQPRAEHVADRLQKEVAVGTDPTSEHDEADVRHCRDGGDVERNPAGHLCDDLAGEVIALAGRGEDVAWLVRRRQCRLHPARLHELLGERA